MAQSRVGNVLQRSGSRIIGLVDMEIEIEAVLDRRPEQDVERLVELGDHIGDAAEQLVAMRLHGGDHRLHMRGIERLRRAEERRGLERDAPGPFCSQLRIDRPGDADLLAQRIEMRPHRGRAMREGSP